MLNALQLEVVKTTLFSGQYNLLLGSGISMDAHDKFGRPLISASKLAESLCQLKGVSLSTSLSRISLLLGPSEVEKYLTSPYSDCKPGDTAKIITSYVWRSVYTFNIDDVLENAYASVARPRQIVEALNYDSPYKTPDSRGKLQVVHLHGFTREAEKKYVFSTSEYGRATRGMNPWMQVLAELIASEPFIISGTSLNEPDLEFYLKDRSESSGRSNRGPSLYVEPFPDKITESLCDRHGLILVKAKLGDFLSWLTEQLGRAPTVVELTIPTIADIFSETISAADQVDFFTSFELVRPASKNPEGEVSPFFFGRAPRWTDLESGLDVLTDGEVEFARQGKVFLDSGKKAIKVLCSIGSAGTGKTTQLRRVAYNLTKEGYLVCGLVEKSPININISVKILSAFNRPLVLLVDALGEHAASLRTLILGVNPKFPILVIAADRDYREDHIERVLGDLDIEYGDIKSWTIGSYETLIEGLRRAGLAGAKEAIYNPARLAHQLLGDAAAIATCRTLNDFRPLESIVRSVWSDASADERRSYAIAAISEHCYPGGISYAVLQAAYPNDGLRGQLSIDRPLPLTFTDDGDYVLPLQAVIAERLMNMLSRDKSSLLFEIFCALATALSPYVNRRTTIARTPEARLAARLFSAEKVVRPLLGERASDFYSKTKDAWQWNPRYWEQRALLTQAQSIELAIQYARHAVAIEEHPFPWTTLASLLTKKMENLPAVSGIIFDEIYELLFKIIRFEENSKNWRSTPHPYVILFNAIKLFYDKGGKLPPIKQEWIRQQIEKTRRLFGRDIKINALADGISIAVGGVASSVNTVEDGKDLRRRKSKRYSR